MQAVIEAAALQVSKWLTLFREVLYIIFTHELYEALRREYRQEEVESFLLGYCLNQQSEKAIAYEKKDGQWKDSGLTDSSLQEGKE